MSLKTFHLFFITVALLFCIGFGIWCLNHADYRALGYGTLAAAAVLTVYEINFVRTFKTR